MILPLSRCESSIFQRSVQGRNQVSVYASNHWPCCFVRRRAVAPVAVELDVSGSLQCARACSSVRPVSMVRFRPLKKYRMILYMGVFLSFSVPRNNLSRFKSR